MFRELNRKLGLYLPNYKISIVNFANSVMKVLGLKPNGTILPDNVHSALEGVESITILVIDGLSSYLIEKAPEFPLIRRKGKYFKISSVFPTTTTTAMASLVTGLEPCEHGVLGYSMLSREVGSIIEIIRTTPYNKIAEIIDPEKFLPVPPIHKKARGGGLDSKLYIKRYLVDTFLTKALYDDAEIVPYVDLEDLMIRLIRERGELISAYWEVLDTAAHVYSPDSEEVRAHVSRILSLISKLPFKKKGRRAFVIVADHGFVDARKRQDRIVDDRDIVNKLYLPPFGDMRATFLLPLENSYDEVLNEVDKRYGKWCLALKKEDALELRLLGLREVGDLALYRLGRLILLPKEGYALDIRPKRRKYEMKGAHSGLSKKELEVPLLIFKY